MCNNNTMYYFSIIGTFNTNFNNSSGFCLLDNEENEPKIKTLRTENTPQKKMVQEMKSGRKSPQSEFAKNLKNNYLKSNDSETSGKNNENIQEVKIYENLAAQMEPVSTKQFTPKTPLFGRAYSTEKNEVRLKFLLNGVDEMKSIFFYFPEMVNIFHIFLQCQPVILYYKYNPHFVLGKIWSSNHKWLFHQRLCLV